MYRLTAVTEDKRVVSRRRRQVGIMMGNHAVSILRREIRKSHNEILELKKEFDDAINFDPDGLRKSEIIQRKIEKRRKIIRDCNKAIELILCETDAILQSGLFEEIGE